MTHEAAGYLLRQYDIAWKLASYHLTGLTTEECLWRPARKGLNVERGADGRWVGQWPEHEGYDLGPPTIAWLTWHIGFWWSMVLDHSFGPGTLDRKAVYWPGSAEATRQWIEELAGQWRSKIDTLGDDDIGSATRTHWPFTGRPFGDVVAWVSLELTKNAAEIGTVRFLHAVKS